MFGVRKALGVARRAPKTHIASRALMGSWVGSAVAPGVGSAIGAGVGAIGAAMPKTTRAIVGSTGARGRMGKRLAPSTGVMYRKLATAGIIGGTLGLLGPDVESAAQGGPAYTNRSGIVGTLSRSVDKLYGLPSGTASGAAGEMLKQNAYKEFLPNSENSRRMRRIDNGLDPDLNATGDLVLSMYQLRRRGF